MSTLPGVDGAIKLNSILAPKAKISETKVDVSEVSLEEKQTKKIEETPNLKEEKIPDIIEENSPIIKDDIEQVQEEIPKDIIEKKPVEIIKEPKEEVEKVIDKSFKSSFDNFAKSVSVINPYIRLKTSSIGVILSTS